MTKREVVKFWRDWCRNNRVPTKIRQQGAIVIAADHEYWECKSMPTLYEALQLNNAPQTTRH